MDKEALLKRAEFFEDVSGQARKEIAHQAILRSAPANEILFHEGSVGSTFYLLVEGAVKLFKSSFKGQEITVKLVRPDEIFAEVILFENDRYPVSAITVRKSRLLVMYRSSIQRLLDNREFRSEFIAALMRKQRYLARRILYLTAHDVEERFFMFLGEHYGKHDRYRMTLSKKDIAAAIGTIPETLSRLILRLKKRGLIGWEGKILTLREGFWEEESPIG